MVLVAVDGLGPGPGIVLYTATGLTNKGSRDFRVKTSGGRPSAGKKPADPVEIWTP